MGSLANILEKVKNEIYLDIELFLLNIEICRCLKNRI